MMTDDNGTPRRRSLARTAFLALGWAAIALQAYNLYLFVGLIGR